MLASYQFQSPSHEGVSNSELAHTEGRRRGRRHHQGGALQHGCQGLVRGEVGELLVKGNGVMKEYYKNPEKTAETIKDGWLHTGDMGKEDTDGFIYLVDRKKDVVISGGENIYPVEIEEVFHTHPKVHDVAVIGVPDERLGEVPAVIIEVKPGETLTEDEVKVRSRVYPSHIDPREQKSSFKEIVFPFTPEEAKAEASRCLRCDLEAAEEGQSHG